jgi:ParB family chromosome partitioning protein
VATKKVLGKGLASLIPAREHRPGATVTLVPVDQIAPNPYQPRKHFTQEALADLAESIKAQGILQPVLVKRVAAGYELIAGERRWRASRLAGLKEIPAVIRDAGREESLAMALVENIQRENLDPVEAALAYQALADEFDLSQEEIASMVGKDRATIANSLRLLKLPTGVQEDLAAGRLSMGHARALLALEEPKTIQKARDEVLSRDLSVRETEALVRRISRGKREQPGRKTRADDPLLADLEARLRRRFSARVEISRKGKGGVLSIGFADEEDLERIIEILEGDRG